MLTIPESELLKDYNPNRIGDYFEAFSKIPRKSGNEQAVSDFLKSFGESLGLETLQDEHNNIIIKKPATPGYEDLPTVILQGHMDMVCQKTPESTHDFSKDPIDLYIDKVINDEGKEITFLKARETTLGADDGMSMAYGMALLSATDVEHPALEVVITTAEETTFDGASHLDVSQLNGVYLFNVDSTNENQFAVGSAGGINTSIEIPLEYENFEEIERKNSHIFYRVSLTGLVGGHSGEDINKGRGNSLYLLGKFISEFLKRHEGYLYTFSGGTADNAIPRDAEALISLCSDVSKEDIEIILDAYRLELRHHYGYVEKNVQIAMEKIDEEVTFKPVKKEITKAILELIKNIPQGPIAMNKMLPSYVDTSNNIGVIRWDLLNNEVIFKASIRSNRENGCEDVFDQITTLAQGYESKGITIKVVNECAYPSWSMKEVSPWRDELQKIHEEFFGCPLNFATIHAGLECSYFVTAKPEIEAVSLGPNTYDLHTPQERMDLDSFVRVFNYIKLVLKKMKKD